MGSVLPFRDVDHRKTDASLRLIEITHQPHRSNTVLWGSRPSLFGHLAPLTWIPRFHFSKSGFALFDVLLPFFEVRL
jgi:hypothetical protein